VNLSFWTLFALLMLAVPLPVLTKHVPIAGLVVGVVIAGSFLVRHVWQAHVRNALLRWGEVAEVTGSHLLARGTYYTGTTVQNTRLSQANGWHVTRRTYSGPISRTRIDYRINGTPASMVLRGLAYTNGVVLADPRKPSRALCVSSFPYDVEPDANGNWPGRVTAGLLAWSVATTLLLLAWAAGVVALYLHYR
jgi:hypothetical protein